MKLVFDKFVNHNSDQESMSKNIDLEFDLISSKNWKDRTAFKGRTQM